MPLMKLNEISLAAFSGFLLILAFPNFNVEILAWVGLIPLFWAIRKKIPFPGRPFGFGSRVCLFYRAPPLDLQCTHLLWTSTRPGQHFFAGRSDRLSGPLFFGLCFHPPLGGRPRTELPETLFAPPLWVSLEYLRGILFSGFPWELLGYSQFLTLPMVQIADITGVYGVSFLIVLVNVALYRSPGSFIESELTTGPQRNPGCRPSSGFDRNLRPMAPRGD